MASLILALSSKETGALLPIYILVIEVSLYGLTCPDKTGKYFLRAFFLTTIIFPAILGSIFLLNEPSWLIGGYQTRPFSLTERLLTESRVIWQYLQFTLLPDISTMGLYHDDIILSTGLLKPISTLFATTSLVGVVIFAIISIKRFPMISFGILWFLAGHLIESTFVPLEIAFEHRNYLALLGPTLTVSYYLLKGGTSPSPSAHRVTIAIALICFLGFNTYVRAFDWSNPLTMAETEATNHPKSARAQYVLGRVYSDLFLETGYFELARKAEKAFIASASNKNSTIGLFGLLILKASQNEALLNNQTQDLLARLSKIPPTQDTYTQVQRLVECKLSNHCQAIPKDTLLKILTATFNNPHLTTNQQLQIQHLRQQLSDISPNK